MTGVLLLALVLSAAPTFPTEPPVRKGILDLHDAVESASFICIGQVDTTFPVDVGSDPIPRERELFATPAERLTFGRIRVERVLKGDPDVQTLFHETWRTWTCDTTFSHAGRRCLFLLGPGLVANMRDEIQAQIASTLGDGPVLRTLGSGDGAVEIRGTSSDEWVEFFGAPNFLRSREEVSSVPASLRPVRSPRAIPLSAFLTYIEDLCRFDPSRLAIRAESFVAWQPNEQPFDLRILPEGSVRLSFGRGGAEIVRVFDLAPSAWDTLQSELGNLATAAGIESRELQPQPRRALSVHLGERSIQFVEALLRDPNSIDPALREPARAGIRAWTLVCDAIPCPECADHRELDAPWLTR